MKPMAYSPTPARRRNAARGPALLTAGALLAAAALLAGPARAQVPTAQPPAPVWTENFGDGVVTSPIPLYANNTGTLGLTTGYSGALGETYSADPAWLPHGATSAATASYCNGWVLSSNDAAAPGASAACTGNGGKFVVYNPVNTVASGLSAWGYLRRMAYVLGLAQGQGTTLAPSNNAVASMTNGGDQPPAQTLQLSIPVIPATPTSAYQPLAGHFYVASTLFAAVHCPADMGIAGTSGWINPEENVNLLANGVMQGTPLAATSTICPRSLSGTTYTPAPFPAAPVAGYYPYQDKPAATGAGDVFVATLYSQPYLATSATTSLGIEVNNLQYQSAANDVAFDSPEILDATPTLYKSFDPNPANSTDGSIGPNGTATLTFEVINTTDYLEKSGWSFTDVLPAGMTIASTPNVQTNCAAATVTATAGNTTITVTGGDIAAGGPPTTPPGTGTCTISVNVTAAVAGVYTNDVTNSAGTPGTVTMDGLVPAPSTSAPANLYVDKVTLNKSATVTDAITHAVKSAVTQAGDVINYTFTLTHSGSAESGEVLVTSTLNWSDPLLAPASVTSTASGFTGGTALSIGSCTSSSGGAVPATLAAGESMICTASYTVTQTDIDSAIANSLVTGGNIINQNATAQITATVPGDPDITITSTPGTTNVPVTPTPGLTVLKTASPILMPAAGQTVAYSVALTNSGNETLHGVTLTDTSFTGSGTTSAALTTALIANCKDSSATPGTLATLAATMPPGDKITCTANYTVTATDVGHGSISNTASATGTDPGGSPVSSTPSGVAVYADAVTLNKTAAVTDGTAARNPKAAVTVAGDIITYTFTLTHTGPATDGQVLDTSTLNWNDPLLAPASVTSTASGFTGGTALSIGNCTRSSGGAMPATLAVGESIKCTATYTVTQTDIENVLANPTTTGGDILNQNATAQITATFPSSSGYPNIVLTSTPGTASVPVTPTPILTLNKSVSPTTMPAAGQTVTYTVTLTNSGAEILNGVTLTDNPFTGGGTTSAALTTALIANCQKNGGTAGALTAAMPMAPTDVVICTADYTVTAADVTKGSISNTASATSTNRSGTSVSTIASTAVVATGMPGGGTPIPALDARALALLALLLAVFGWQAQRKRQR